MLFQMNFEVISALLLAGFLFLFLGLMSLSRHAWHYYNEQQQTKRLADRGDIPPAPSLQEANLTKYSKVPTKLCRECGEPYPLDTIHTKCLLCRSDL